MHHDGVTLLIEGEIEENNSVSAPVRWPAPVPVQDALGYLMVGVCPLYRRIRRVFPGWSPISTGR